ncbi:MAG: hypothetical protein NT162_03860 [Candidatus Woesebacteria bacterium]|nr:hypothetical protein [Candidatus Woesebacteria bacterium]
MPQEPLYPRKSLRHQICEFFREIRINETGIGTPFEIKLGDMSSLLQYAQGDDRLEALRLELYDLDRERFGTSMDRPVISIINLPSSENFATAFQNNNSLEVRCASENIEDYIQKLEERTQAARSHFGLVELNPLSSGGVRIVLGDKTMKVTKSRINGIDLRINIVRLMYGESVALLDRDISMNEYEIDGPYERGNFVNYEDLLSALRIIEGNEESLSIITLGSIEDAIIGLNDRSMEKFGRSLFVTNDGGLKWGL